MKLIFEETRPVSLVYRSYGGGKDVRVTWRIVAQYAKAQRVLVVDLTIVAEDENDVPGVDAHERRLLTIDTRSEAIRKAIQIADEHHEAMAIALAIERSKHPEPGAAPEATPS